VAIVYPRESTPLEEFSAKEIQRYVYLRTGVLAELIKGDEITDGYDDCILVGRKDRGLFSKTAYAPELLAATKALDEGFYLQTYLTSGSRQHVIVGGSGPGTLYGAYRFVEATGVRFSIEGDVIPEGTYDLAALRVNEKGEPRFAKRGIQPFHDFSVGPDWWNAHDYKSVLSQMAKLRMNFIGLHTYPSWNPSAGPEANVWIGLPDDVDEQGNVRSGYEAGVVTTRRGWMVNPFPTSQYASGAGLLFESDDYAPDFMLDCLEWPRTDSAATVMFNRYGDFQKSVFEDARRLGIETCLGTELPLGVPPMLASRLKSRGLSSGDPAAIRTLYEGTFLRLMRKMPIDYFWFWLPEIWLWSEPGCTGWEITTEKNAKRDIALIDSAAKRVKAPFGFATSGWRLGTRNDPLWVDRNTPKSWAVSSINTSLGRDPVEKSYGDMAGRPKWAIGWAEDDDAAHCCTAWDLQLWVERMFKNSAEASGYGCEGMMAIHWRTASIAPNMTALSQAGWQFENRDIQRTNSDSGQALDLDSFWQEWGRGMFGGEAGVEAGRQLQRFDGGHLQINAMIQGGWKTTDSAIAAFFTPLVGLESLRPQVQGAGNLERLDYWINYIKASQDRVRTWVLASRLDSLVRRAGSMRENEERQRFLQEEVLPLRISIARSYEALIGAFVDCARSPGEIGTIANIESGHRQRIVHGQDTAVARLLGTPLPKEAAINTSYRGVPRIFVSSMCTQWRRGEPLEVRPFVLSTPKCTGVTLHWRYLGEHAFKNVAATQRARQAYRVDLPTDTGGTVEYYLEAAFEDGTNVVHPATAPSMNQTVIVW
jgi:hypothetical protein